MEVSCSCDPARSRSARSPCAALLAACSQPHGRRPRRPDPERFHGPHRARQARLRQRPPRHQRALLRHLPRRGRAHCAEHPPRRRPLRAEPRGPALQPHRRGRPDGHAPTYDHLEAGLIRVALTLADNLDVIDDSGNVITNATAPSTSGAACPASRTPPTPRRTSTTARFATLPDPGGQRARRRTARSTTRPRRTCSTRSPTTRAPSSRVRRRAVGAAIAAGHEPPNRHPALPARLDGAKGEMLFNQACAQCHGTPTQVNDHQRGRPRRVLPGDQPRRHGRHRLHAGPTASPCRRRSPQPPAPPRDQHRDRLRHVPRPGRLSPPTSRGSTSRSTASASGRTRPGRRSSWTCRRCRPSSRPHPGAAAVLDRPRPGNHHRQPRRLGVVQRPAAPGDRQTRRRTSTTTARRTSPPCSTSTARSSSRRFPALNRP